MQQLLLQDEDLRVPTKQPILQRENCQPPYMRQAATSHTYQCAVPYSLSDPSLANLFFITFLTKSLSLPSKIGEPLKGTTVCIYILSVLTP